MSLICSLFSLLPPFLLFSFSTPLSKMAFSHFARNLFKFLHFVCVCICCLTAFPFSSRFLSTNIMPNLIPLFTNKTCNSFSHAFQLQFWFGLIFANRKQQQQLSSIQKCTTKYRRPTKRNMWKISTLQLNGISTDQTNDFWLEQWRREKWSKSHFCALAFSSINWNLTVNWRNMLEVDVPHAASVRSLHFS